MELYWVGLLDRWAQWPLVWMSVLQGLKKRIFFFNVPNQYQCYQGYKGFQLAHSVSKACALLLMFLIVLKNKQTCNVHIWEATSCLPNGKTSGSNNMVRIQGWKCTKSVSKTKHGVRLVLTEGTILTCAGTGSLVGLHCIQCKFRGIRSLPGAMFVALYQGRLQPHLWVPQVPLWVPSCCIPVPSLSLGPAHPPACPGMPPTQLPSCQNLPCSSGLWLVQARLSVLSSQCYW